MVEFKHMYSKARPICNFSETRTQKQDQFVILMKKSYILILVKHMYSKARPICNFSEKVLYFNKKSPLYGGKTQFTSKSYIEGPKCPIKVKNVLFKKSPIWMKFPPGTPDKHRT